MSGFVWNIVLHYILALMTNLILLNVLQKYRTSKCTCFCLKKIVFENKPCINMKKSVTIKKQCIYWIPREHWFPYLSKYSKNFALVYHSNIYLYICNKFICLEIKYIVWPSLSISGILNRRFLKWDRYTQ